MNEVITIDGEIKLTIIDVINLSAKIAIQAPPAVSIFRKETCGMKHIKLRKYVKN